jgi:hypothetical protein
VVEVRAVRWFTPIDFDNDVSDPLVVRGEGLGGFAEEDFRAGWPVTGWDGSATFRSRLRKEDGDPDDILQTDVNLPIYSARLRAALCSAGVDGIQYLPVRVYRSDGTPVPDFAIVNVTVRVPALDLSRSDYVVFGDERPDRRGEIKALSRPCCARPPWLATTSCGSTSTTGLSASPSGSATRSSPAASPAIPSRRSISPRGKHDRATLIVGPPVRRAGRVVEQAGLPRRS